MNFKIYDFINSFTKKEYKNEKKKLEYKLNLLNEIDKIENQIQATISQIKILDLENRGLEEHIKAKEENIEQLSTQEKQYFFENSQLEKELLVYKEKVIGAFKG